MCVRRGKELLTGFIFAFSWMLKLLGIFVEHVGAFVERVCTCKGVFSFADFEAFVAAVITCCWVPVEVKDLFDPVAASFRELAM